VNPILLHLVLDVVALLVAVAAGVAVYKSAFPDEYKHPAVDGYRHYLFTLSFGAVCGAMVLGTLNLYVSGVTGVGRSILGAILGAIAAVEWYKARHGIHESTGAALVVPLGTGIAVGRIGCFLVGLPDYTYGTPTTVPWGRDFGDGVLRHPVQLYEAFFVALATLVFIFILKLRPHIAVKTGFYLFVAWYGTQRFALEFIKPYADVLGSLNVFHLGSLVLIAYALFMLDRAKSARS
jgi:prolipoprotein diacylglyceryltransferase